MFQYETLLNSCIQVVDIDFSGKYSNQMLLLMLANVFSLAATAIDALIVSNC